MMRFLPSGKMTWSTCGLIFSHLYWCRLATSISESKWPMLHTIAWSFIFSMWSCVITLTLPVAVTKMSALSAA